MAAMSDLNPDYTLDKLKADATKEFEEWLEDAKPTPKGDAPGQKIREIAHRHTPEHNWQMIAILNNDSWLMSEEGETGADTIEGIFHAVVEGEIEEHLCDEWVSYCDEAAESEGE